MMSLKSQNQKCKNGFTLIELLAVLGILVLLLAIVLIAINPGKHFKETNNVKRRNDVITLLNAVQQYAIDHSGNLPSGVTTSAQTLSSSDLDICDILVTEYVAQMPFDPDTGHFNDCNDYNTHYTIKKGDNSRITIEAPDAEDDVDISVTR